MKPAVMDQKQIYHEINAVTGTAHSVVFGTEILAELPISELVQDLGLNISVCNRSVEEAVLADAFDLLEECVYELHPGKVFLNFGETDLRRGGFDEAAFLADYRRLIEAIRSRLNCRVFVISVLDNNPEARHLNEELGNLAGETGCSYVDAQDIFAHERPRLRLFSELIHHMRDGRISFSDAMHFCEV